jgi:aspartate racemase
MNQSKTRTIGLICLGKRSTLFYQQQFENNNDGQLYLKKFDTNFKLINQYLPDQFEYLDVELKLLLDQVFKENINICVMPNISIHQSFQHLTFKATHSQKVIHPVTETLKTLAGDKKINILLLASKYTTNAAWIKQHFLAQQIDIHSPEQEEIGFIEELRKAVYFSCVNREMTHRYLEMVTKYARQMAVVIGCTELSLLLPDKPIENVYDMSKIQIQSAIKQAHNLDDSNIL